MSLGAITLLDENLASPGIMSRPGAIETNEDLRQLSDLNDKYWRYCESPR